MQASSLTTVVLVELFFSIVERPRQFTRGRLHYGQKIRVATTLLAVDGARSALVSVVHVGRSLSGVSNSCVSQDIFSCVVIPQENPRWRIVVGFELLQWPYC